MNDERTVFLVDDDPRVLRAISRLLSLAGFRTERFRSGREFLDQYHPGLGGCLVLDVMMPELTGLDVQERLKNAGIPIPIIFLSAKGESEERQKVLERGAVAFLTKPATAAELLASIEKAFAQTESKSDSCVASSGI